MGCWPVAIKQSYATVVKIGHKEGEYPKGPKFSPSLFCPLGYLKAKKKETDKCEMKSNWNSSYGSRIGRVSCRKHSQKENSVTVREGSKWSRPRKQDKCAAKGQAEHLAECVKHGRGQNSKEDYEPDMDKVQAEVCDHVRG